MNMTAHRETREPRAFPIVPSSAAEDYVARGAEAERQRVRKVLHDGLGQLLTSISFLASSLRQNLEARDLPEAEAAEDIIALTKKAINETQRLVHEGDSPGAKSG